MSTLTSATVTISGQPANSNNVSLVGRISCYCTVTVPASYVPTAPGSVTLTRVDNGVPTAWGVYVQNKSKLNVSWSAASGTGGATISQYRIYTDTGSGYYTATGTSIANLGPFTAGAKMVTVVAVDSRGRTATSAGVAYEVQPYDTLAARYEAAHARLGEIEAARTERRAKRANISRFLKTLIQHDACVTEFEEELWYLTADRVRAYEDGRLVVCFRDGCEVEVQAQAQELKAA